MMPSSHHFASTGALLRNVLLLFSLLFSREIFGQDVTPPTIVCPQNYSAIFHVGSCDTIYNYPTPIAFDNNPGVSVTQTGGLASGMTFPIGTTANSFVATDAAGNTSTCSFTVSLDIQPALDCKSGIVNVYLNQDCQAFLNAVDLQEEPLNLQCTDSLLITYGIPPMIHEPLRPFVQSDVGQPYYYSLKNRINGNSCFGQFRVLDTLPPVPVCADIILPLNVPAGLLSPVYLVDTLGIPDGTIQFTDNCGGPDSTWFSDMTDVYSCSHPLSYTKSINRTWSVTDINGNVGSCVQHIYFKRDSAYILFPADTVLPCDYAGAAGVQETGFPFTEVNGIRFSLNPAVPSGYFITFEDTLQPFQCPGSRILKRFWSVTDVCNNTPPYLPDLTHIQLITFLDDAPPLITAPAKVTFSGTAVDCRDTVLLPTVLIKDACSPPDSITATWMHTDSTSMTIAGQLTAPGGGVQVMFDTAAVFSAIPDFPAGLTTVTWTAWDACGNSTTATTIVEFYDGTAPIITCKPEVTVYLDNTGQATLNAADFLDQWEDVCADTVVVRARKEATSDPFAENLIFNCNSGGFNLTYTVRAYDVLAPSIVPDSFGLGQYGSCTVSIVVNDTSFFQCTPPADVTIPCSDFNPDLNFYGSFEFTCATDSVQYLDLMDQFDTSCNSGIITRVATAYRGNQTVDCFQTIIINNLPNQYYVRFPDDVDVTDCSIGPDFGAPEIVGTVCQQPDISYTDEVFLVVLDACYKIERVWRIANHCAGNAPLTEVLNPFGLAGAVVSAAGAAPPWSPTVAPFVPSGMPVNYSIYWTPDGGGYEYRQIIKFSITENAPVFCPSGDELVCDSTDNDPALWNHEAWINPGTGLQDKPEAADEFRVYFQDQCYRPATLKPQVNFTLDLDLDNDETAETFVNQAVPAASGVVIFGNKLPTVPDVTATFDNRQVQTSEKYRFSYQLVYEDTVAYVKLTWITQSAPDVHIAPQLPAGKHKITWTITDYCANTSTCIHAVEVKECCPAPCITCISQTVQYYLQNGVGIVNATDLLTNVEENGCTVNLGVSQDSIIPLELEPSMLVNCFQTGVIPVTVFARNEDDLSVSCTAMIEIIDTSGVSCNPADLVVGQISTYTTFEGVNNVNVRLISGVSPQVSVPTNTEGEFYAGAPGLYSSGYEVNPYKNDDPTNGLTAFDLIKISRHILNFEPLAFPFQMIAADANQSGTITTFDIVELRKLLLGTYDTLPNCPSWRFIPADYVFNAQNNTPFQPPFPETIPVAGAVGYTFTAVKVGDLDYSVIPNFKSPETEDRALQTSFLNFNDQWMEADKPVAITFTPEPGMAALQGTLEFTDAVVTDIQPAPGGLVENFALFNENQVLTFVSFPTADPFTVVITPRKSGFLSEKTGISSAITPALGFNEKGLKKRLDLRSHSNGKPAMASNIKLTCIPNPLVDGKGDLQFKLEQPGHTIIQIQDVNGRTMWQNVNWRAGGNQRVGLETEGWPAGIYMVCLESPEGVTQIKIVVK